MTNQKQGPSAFDSVFIVAAAEDDPPFAVEGQVIEEDTQLVLSPPEKVIEKPQETLSQLMKQAVETLPVKPGTVLVKPGKPVRFLAVVHNLDEHPSWREEWIGQAYERIFREARTRSLQSLATPLLGTVHGDLAIDRAYELFRRALEDRDPGQLKSIWLVLRGNQTGPTYHLQD